MDFKDMKFTPVIENGKQLYDAYPEIFDEAVVDNSVVYMEKANPNTEEEFIQENRIFILPSGVVSVTERDLDFLWSINKDDKDLLGNLNANMESVNRERLEKKNPKQFQIKYINGIEYGIKYYFYKDPTSCDVVMDELDKKVLARKGLPPKR